MAHRTPARTGRRLSRRTACSSWATTACTPTTRGSGWDSSPSTRSWARRSLPSGRPRGSGGCTRPRPRALRAPVARAGLPRRRRRGRGGAGGPGRSAGRRRGDPARGLRPRRGERLEGPHTAPAGGGLRSDRARGPGLRVVQGHPIAHRPPGAAQVQPVAPPPGGVRPCAPTGLRADRRVPRSPAPRDQPGHQEGRRRDGLRRGRVHRGQGDAGPDDAALPPPVPEIRVRPQQGLRNARALERSGPPRPHAHPSPVLQGRGGERHRGRGDRGGTVNEEDDIERFEEERELELYREYRDVVPMFTYVVETERRFYLANVVDVQQRDDGWVEVRLSDAWVWDVFRPARFVSNVRVMTRRDVNVEELRRDEAMPGDPTVDA